MIMQTIWFQFQIGLTRCIILLASNSSQHLIVCNGIIVSKWLILFQFSSEPLVLHRAHMPTKCWHKNWASLWQVSVLLWENIWTYTSQQTFPLSSWMISAVVLKLPMNWNQIYKNLCMHEKLRVEIFIWEVSFWYVAIIIFGQ